MNAKEKRVKNIIKNYKQLYDSAVYISCYDAILELIDIEDCINNCNLTKEMRRRLNMYKNGLETKQIAEIEGIRVDRTNVCLNSAVERVVKYSEEKNL